MINYAKIRHAVEAVEQGIKRVDVTTNDSRKIVVYAVGDNVIRIDIKKGK